MKLTKAQEKKVYSRQATREDVVDIIDNAVEVALSKQKKEIIEKLEEMKAERVSVLNGKIRMDIRKDSRLHNDYGENLCWNSALDQAIKTI